MLSVREKFWRWAIYHLNEQIAAELHFKGRAGRFSHPKEIASVVYEIAEEHYNKNMSRQMTGDEKARLAKQCVIIGRHWRKYRELQCKLWGGVEHHEASGGFPSGVWEDRERQRKNSEAFQKAIKENPELKRVWMENLAISPPHIGMDEGKALHLLRAEERRKKIRKKLLLER